MLKQQIRILTSSGSVLRNIGVLTVVASIGSAGLALSTAQADDFVVNEETTAQNGDAGNTIDGGDSLTIKKTGSVTTSVENTPAVRATGNGNKVTSKGLIKTENVNDADAINVDGTGNEVINEGEIVTKGASSEGVFVNGGSNTLLNKGIIKTEGSGAYGILYVGGQNAITNEGVIETTGISGNGIRVDGNQNKVTNSGRITTEGLWGNGFYIEGNNNIAENSGDMLLKGANADGFWTKGNDHTITNSGRIVSKRLGAISLHNGVTNTKVNLHTGGFLAGDVNMGTSGGAGGSTNQLNIHSNKGTSVMWRIKGYMKDTKPTAVGSVPIFFGTDANNNALHHVATYDPTTLAASVNALGAISGNVSALVQNRFDGEETSDNGWWMSGLFSSGEYTQNAVMLDYDLRQYSGAIGYDTEISDGMRLGGMVGYGTGTLTADGRWMASHDNKASGLFGALYARNRMDNMFIDLTLAGGNLSHSDKRFVNDNSLASGIATAKGDYDSWWVAPELGIGVDLEEKLDTWQLTPSARVRYARHSIDGFTETGIAAAGGNAKVADRTIGMVETRLEMAVSKPLERFIHETVNSGKITLRAGWQMRRAMGDNTVNVTLLGNSQSVSYKTDNTNSAYLGGAVSMKLDNGMALNLGGELNVGSGIEHIRTSVGPAV